MNQMLPILVLTCLAFSGTAVGLHPQIANEQPAQSEIDFSDVDAISKSKWFRAFKADWESVYGITVGMTVKELGKHVARQNSKTHDLPVDDIKGILKPGNHSFSKHSTSPAQELSDGNGSITYRVIGEHQFWIDLAIENFRIKNIYVAFGNGAVASIPVRLDGTGTYRSELFRQLADLHHRTDPNRATTNGVSDGRAVIHD